MKRIVILGSTGSIGVNSLHVAQQLAGDFDVIALSTHHRVELLLEQCARFHPAMVAISGSLPSDSQLAEFDNLGIRVFVGQNALLRVVDEADYDLLINAVVGAAGFVPTLHAIQRGKDIALANKETLVVGGQIVMSEVKKHRVTILPIDSEHSAIFQCLMGENKNSIEEIILTASGGPFRKLPAKEFVKVTPEQALKHPNWNMGKKITIDSATMMNKGLEVIEAHWLFEVPVEKVRVMIHPQSIIHSMVAFHDGSYKAQLGMPDMRVPIQLAMTYPRRKPSTFPRIDFSLMNRLDFEEPDTDKFRALALAYDAIKKGGTAPAVMNAANEEAVYLFLQKTIRFDQIPQTIEKALNAHHFIAEPGVEDLLQADQWARQFARSLCD